MPRVGQGRFGAALMMMVLGLALTTASPLRAQTFPVTGRAGFDTGLHDLAFLTVNKNLAIGIFWGDGAESPGLYRCYEPVLHPNQCHVFGSHAYQAPGTYTIQISYVPPGLFSGRTTAFTTATILPANDFVILSIGDSVASGEGSPVVQWTAAGMAPFQGFWDDPGSNYVFPPPLTPEQVENARRCHRSRLGGPALAAQQVGATNPVTFVHYACSGATVTAVRSDHSDLIQQLRLARKRLDRIDVLLISGGSNNMMFRKKGPLGSFNGEMGLGFGEVITRCLRPLDPCSEDADFTTDISDSIEGNPTRIEHDNGGIEYRFPGLSRMYADLDKLIHCINPADDNPEPGCSDEQIPTLVLITEYYDPTHDETGQFPGVGCPDAGIKEKEWRYLYESVMLRLNHHVRTSPWRAVVGLEADFLTHGYCSSDRWVVRAGESFNRQNDRFGSGHPNETGQAAYHARIYQALLALNPPVTAASATADGSSYEFGTPTDRHVTVALAAHNPIKESGTGRTFFAVDNPACDSAVVANCTLYTGPFVIDTPGTHTVRFFTENASGAFEEANTVVVQIERLDSGGCATPPPHPSWVCDGDTWVPPPPAPTPPPPTPPIDDECTTVRPGPTWLCVDRGWVPPDHPVANRPPSPPGGGACNSPQPGPTWVCVDGGWVPPDHPLANGMPPSSPPSGEECATPRPGPTWVCVNGGWLPPDHPSAAPAAAPSPPTPGACTTPRPGSTWVCAGGGWVPPDHPLAKGG
jgi:hypothetical protein